MERCVEAYMETCMAAYEKKWLWRGTEYDFDLCGLGDGVRLNIALAWLRQGLGQLPTDGKLTEKQEELYGLMAAFFDIVLGDGKGAGLGCVTAEDWVEAYLDFMDYVLRQNEMVKRFRTYAEERYVEKANVLASGVAV